MNNQDQLEIPIQPVENPILCNPYEEPDAHWLYDTETGEAIRQPGRREAGFPEAALVVCPNLTIKERLQVLRPETAENYYDAFEPHPVQTPPLLNSGKVLVTNWHQFAPESKHTEGGQSYVIVNKGEETPDAFAQRVLGELYDRAPVMVLNDEAHHAYRPASIDEQHSERPARVQHSLRV